MRELARQQQAFAAAIASVASAAYATPLFRGTPAAVLDRLAVYRGNWYANAGKALAGAYPVTAKIVGAEFFEALAREYLRRHASTSGDLNEHGEAFPGFVSGFEHTRDLPYLPDVARLEWLVHRAYYAADAAPADPRTLAPLLARDPAALRLTLAPACATIESRWPVARIWEIHQDDCAGDFSVDLDAGAQRAVVHRPRFRVAVAALAPGAFRFLERTAAGGSIASALEAALQADARFDFAAALDDWAGAGIVTGFSLHRESPA
jgi:hypothetical protein